MFAPAICCLPPFYDLYTIQNRICVEVQPSRTNMTVIPEIPTIDLSSYIRPDATPEERTGVIEDVRSACSRYGFLQVKGHGVPLATQREVLESCRRLFDLSQKEKDSLSLKNNPARRGYERIGEQVLDAKALPDCKEVRLCSASTPSNRAAYRVLRATTLAERYR